MPRHKGGLSVQMDGMQETLRAFSALDKDLRRNTNAELRAAAKTCATVLAGLLAQSASSSGVPVAARVARSIKVKSDRLPVVTIGGPMKVGSGKRAAAGSLVWGSEQGPKSDPNRFGVPPSRGYWIAPAVARFTQTGATDTYKRTVFELQRKHGLV